jgi:argininosuccinate lyase
VSPELQWGGRFSAPPDAKLLAFGSSLAEDLVLAPFDVACSKAHVVALRDGGVLNAGDAQVLTAALDEVAAEIQAGTFAVYARESGAEDVHGAIDARVRELAPRAGELLHAGRSRNDQVATTLLLYCIDRAAFGKNLALQIASHFAARARAELKEGALLAAATHWQPAQPVLLSFWLTAAAEPFLRSAQRLARAGGDAAAFCPLGSGAVAGTSLPLNRASSAAALGFRAPSRNAMDAIGNRDAALDLAHACVRAALEASRICEELVIWCTPAFGYARLDDAASTGSSLMPQKRNPDPFELVRANAAELIGKFAGALATTSGIALSYHRDLQVTKAAVLGIVEQALAALNAFAIAIEHVAFMRGRMSAMAGEHYTVATDVADALIRNGASAREAHAKTGAQIVEHERDGAPLDWPDARASVEGKATTGSTSPSALAQAIAELEAAIEEARRP